MPHHERRQFVPLEGHPKELDYKQVSASTYSTIDPPPAAQTTVFRWTPSFAAGGISLEAGIFYPGQSTPDHGWREVQNGLMPVWSDSQQVTKPLSEATPTTSPSVQSPTTSAVTSPEAPSSITPQASSTLTAPTPSNTSGATTIPQTQDSSGTSSGAIIGAAVGCLVGGVLIGGLVAWLVLRKRRGRQAATTYAPVRYESPEKQPATITTAAASSRHSGTGLDQFLLDCTPDRELASEAKSLNLLIQQHVEDNYHLHEVQQDPNLLAKTLVDLEIGTQHGTGAFGPVHLANLALDPRTRYATLRHVIAQAASNASSVHSSGPISLLPHQLGSMVRGVPPVEPHRGSAEAVATALTRWRQLSAFLLNPSRSERTPLAPTEDVSTQQAQHLTSILNRFTGVFVSGSREQAYEQENHLREVIVEFAKFGYVLFSQPAEFRFSFNDTGGEQRRGKHLVAFPGIEKVRDEAGTSYQSPVTLTEPIVER